MSFRFSLLALLSFGFALSAAAQFGPKPETPRNAEEIYADRAVVTAGNFLQPTLRDTASVEDGVDPERANYWYGEAINAYTPLCDDRDAPKDFWSRNCYKLAGLYLRGQGIVQNYQKADSLFSAACLDANHVDACLQQAHVDHTGNAGQTDWPAARLLYQRACTLNAPSGCAGLGNMLYRGQGGPTDRSRGTRLLQQACAAEYTWACERLTGFGLPERAVR